MRTASRWRPGARAPAALLSRIIPSADVRQRHRRRLRGRGMGLYAPAFHKHEVSMEVLPYLSLEELAEIGVATVGARRKLLLAIDEMWA